MILIKKYRLWLQMTSLEQDGSAYFWTLKEALEWSLASAAVQPANISHHMIGQ